jgi:hypothetical protein
MQARVSNWGTGKYVPSGNELASRTPPMLPPIKFMIKYHDRKTGEDTLSKSGPNTSDVILSERTIGKIARCR